MCKEIMHSKLVCMSDINIREPLFNDEKQISVCSCVSVVIKVNKYNRSKQLRTIQLGKKILRYRLKNMQMLRVSDIELGMILVGSFFTCFMLYLLHRFLHHKEATSFARTLLFTSPIIYIALKSDFGYVKK